LPYNETPDVNATGVIVFRGVSLGRVV